MRQRSDRWGDDPVLNKDGEAIAVHRPTAGDLAKFELLTSYRTLSAPFLAALLKTDMESVRKRLKILQRSPNRYLDLYNRDQQRRWVGLNGYQWFSLAKKGADVLRERGRDVPEPVEGKSREFAHEAGVQATLASLDIGIRQGGGRMVYADEIRDHANFPALTKNSYSPLAVEVSIRKTFETGHTLEKTFHYRSDGLRAIKYPSGEWLFINFEYEHMNRADSTNFNTTSFLQKFLAVQSLQREGLCEKRWGIPRESFYTLVATPSTHHIESMKSVILRETKGTGSEYVAFHLFPSLIQTLSILPMPELYTHGWQRVGYPDLRLAES